MSSSCAAVRSQMSLMDGVRDLVSGRSRKSSQTRALVAAAVLLVLVPFETEHLFTMLIGALVYLLVHVMQPKVARVRPPVVRSSDKATKFWDEHPELRRSKKPWHPKAWKFAPLSPCTTSSSASDSSDSPCSKPAVRTQSVVPVQAPTFNGSCWDDDVKELIGQITPSAKCHEAVAKIALLAQRTMEPLLPGVQVLSFASGNIEGGKAFGVAVPDFDLVAKVPAASLIERAPKCGDAKQAMKNILRSCCERLVAKSGLKFRRSAFKGDEPKITLLAPAALGFSAVPVPINFSVNSTTPVNNAKLLAQCAKVDARASSLILLVRRWAKDRGISHAAKGHLSSYEWSLLAIFFMQVGLEEGPLLPAVKDLASGKTGVLSDKSVGQLFQEFFLFYTSAINWDSEAIAVREGLRHTQLPEKLLHKVERVGGVGVEVAPSIEDPFDSSKNLGAILSSGSLARFKEELQRARDFVDRGASLAELLEPWAPAAEDAADSNRC